LPDFSEKNMLLLIDLESLLLARLFQPSAKGIEFENRFSLSLKAV